MCSVLHVGTFSGLTMFGTFTLFTAFDTFSGLASIKPFSARTASARTASFEAAKVLKWFGQ